MAKKYGRIRWVEELKDIPESAEYIVCKTKDFFVELLYADSDGLRWVLAQTSLNAMSEANYEYTLTEFRRIADSNKTIWVVMPPWKYYKVHPEMDFDFD